MRRRGHSGEGSAQLNVRSKWDKAPFIYVTAVTNRLCHFPDEASQKYAQEFPSSHNAGVALKHVMPYFVSAIAQ